MSELDLAGDEILTDLSENLDENLEQDKNYEPEVADEAEFQENGIEGDALAGAQEKIKALEAELATARADFYNARQRFQKDSQETRRRTQEDVVIQLLPALDILDMALRTPVSSDNNAAQVILKGVEMTRAQFLNILGELGVSVIPVSRGSDFDPRVHHASGVAPVDDPELDGKVLDEQIKGYQTKNRVLRPAQVSVGKLVASD